MLVNRIFPIVLISLCSLCACKKTATNTYSADTFFKVYNAPIAKDLGSNATTNSSGAVTSDANGNIYILYYDALLANNGALYMLKTDKYGKMVFNKRYFKFYLYQQVYYYIANFICLDETLYLAGLDSTGKWTILKINCTDGQVAGQIPLAGIIPPGAKVSSFSIADMWQTKAGNLLINAYYTTPLGYTKPILSLLSPDGTIIWSKSDFPFPLFKSGDYEEGSCISELANGNFVFGTVGVRWTNTAVAYETKTVELNFYTLSSGGSLLSVDSLTAGGEVQYYYISGIYNKISPEILSFFLFPSPLGGYIIAANEYYGYTSQSGNYLYRLKVIKTDISFHVLDSAYVNPANSDVNISGIVQKADGSIMVSLEDQQLPVTNDLCYLYEIAPDASVKKVRQVGLSSQSTFISGMSQANDGHIVMGGLIQTNGIDTNNIFILKTDGNGNY
jgi:hypothetical protein